jgi:hypothetical protein
MSLNDVFHNFSPACMFCLQVFIEGAAVLQPQYPNYPVYKRHKLFKHPGWPALAAKLVSLSEVRKQQYLDEKNSLVLEMQAVREQLQKMGDLQQEQQEQRDDQLVSQLRIMQQQMEKLVLQQACGSSSGDGAGPSAGTGDVQPATLAAPSVPVSAGSSFVPPATLGMHSAGVGLASSGFGLPAAGSMLSAAGSSGSYPIVSAFVLPVS